MKPAWMRILENLREQARLAQQLEMETKGVKGSPKNAETN